MGYAYTHLGLTGVDEVVDGVKGFVPLLFVTDVRSSKSEQVDKPSTDVASVQYPGSILIIQGTSDECGQ